MKAIKYSLLVVAIATVASVVIRADEEEKAAASMGHKVFSSATIEWGDPPPGLPAGAKFAVLSGNPGAQGVFTARLQAPAGYKIPAHSHPTDELTTVISGTLHLGTGDKLDESKGDAIAAGSFTAMPAGMKHYAYMTEDTVVQISGSGPFEIKYVNPNDDPRVKK